MDAEGATCFGWLRVEIHRTARRPPAPAASGAEVAEAAAAAEAEAAAEEAAAAEEEEVEEGERGAPYQASIAPCPPKAAPVSRAAVVRDAEPHPPADASTDASTDAPPVTAGVGGVVSGPFVATLQPDGAIHSPYA